LKPVVRKLAGSTILELKVDWEQALSAALLMFTGLHELAVHQKIHFYTPKEPFLKESSTLSDIYRKKI